MAVLKEWNCIEHGEFEGSHPICPAAGCRSISVAQQFRTPVAIGSRNTRAFDAGIRRSADLMQIDDFKSAKPGESSFAGRADPNVGTELLWGDQCRKVMGRDFKDLVGLAQKPQVFKKRDGTPIVLERNNGLREAATESAITRRRLPQAYEVTAHPQEKNGKAQARRLVE